MSSEQQERSNRIRGPVQDHYDCIVVGSGIGGLTTAALLAKRGGKRVLVLDQHYVAGGNSASFRRKKFEFNIGLHYVGECGPGERITRILDACGVADLEFLPMAEGLEMFTVFDGDGFTVPSTREQYRQRLLDRFPDERQGIDRYCRFLEQAGVASRAEFGGSWWDKLLVPFRCPMVVRYMNKTAAQFIDSCTSNPELYTTFTAQSGAYGLPPSQVSVLFHTGLQNHYFTSGGWYPVGGGQAMADGLAETIEASGSDIRLRCDVREITVEGGRATGVVFDSKQLGTVRVTAPVVISNADLKKTVQELVGPSHFPARFNRKIQHFEMTMPLFIAFVGLDFPPEDLPFGNGNQWLTDTIDLDAFYAGLERGEVLDRPPLLISSTSQRDSHNPRVAPPGQCNLELLTAVPRDPGFWGVTEEQIVDGSYSRDERYLQVKKEYTQRCLDQASRLIPDLQDHVVFLESATPMTQARYTRSTDGGPYGFAALPSQFLGKRPGARSPLRGLYFCGANCRSGFGIMGSMLSGLYAAEALMGNGIVRRVLQGDGFGP